MKCVAVFCPLHGVIFESHQSRVIMYSSSHTAEHTVEKGGGTGGAQMQGDKIEGGRGLMGKRENKEQQQFYI